MIKLITETIILNLLSLAEKEDQFE
jgi:hypothetical protein